MAEAALLEREATEQQINELAVILPEVLVVPNMLNDQEVRQKAAQFIGSVAAGEIAEIVPVETEPSIGSLYEGIKLAAEGDPIALKLVRSNAKTDTIERTIKTGHVTDPVVLKPSEIGGFIQHGQTTESIQANSLQFAAEHPIMRARNEAETRNAFRTKYLFENGLFEDYNLVVVSRAENLPKAGFFTETMSCCLQVTSKHDEGLQIESAFVSGIATRSGEQHDAETVIKFGKKLDEDVDFTGMTQAQIIDHPILIRKDKMPDGVINLVELFDDCVELPEGKTGEIFFGELKPKEDYLAYRQKCHEREKGFDKRVNKIVTELISEAPSIFSPVMATERLHDISEKHMVEQAVIDTSIDARVFGPTAAPHIEQARLDAQAGNWGGMDHHMRKAKDTAESYSCPGGGKAKGLKDELGSDNNSSEEESDEECDFISKECPLCKKKDVKTYVTKTHIRGDCGCSVKKAKS